MHLPFGIRASASASSASSSSSPAFGSSSGGVNRLWHYNSQGLNTNSVWFSPVSRSNSGGVSGSSSFDSEAVESSQAPVAVKPETPSTASSTTVTVTSSLPSASASSSSSSPNPVFFRRQPILADENDSLDASSNSLSKRIGGAPSNRIPSTVGSFGEYRSRGESERNLYYPDISRIQASNSIGSSSNGAIASSSSSASAASSSSSSSTSSNSVSGFGFKGGAGTHKLDAFLS